MALRDNRVKEITIKEIYEICTKQTPNGKFKECKEHIAEKVHEAWKEMYALTPKTSVIIGLILLFSNLFIERVIVNPDTGIFMVKVTLALAAAGVLTPLGGWLNINYKNIEAVGAVAIFVLVFAINPAENKTKITLDSPQSGSMSISGVAYAGDNKVQPERIPMDPYYGLDRVYYIRIYYPIGLKDLKRDAFRMREKILSEKRAERVDIYSLGSYFVAPGNLLQYKKENVLVNVDYRPGIGKKLIDKIVEIVMITGVRKEDIIFNQDYTSADISIRFKIK